MTFFQQTYKGLNHWWRYAIILSVFLTPFLSGFINSFIIKPLLLLFPDNPIGKFAIKQLKYIIFVILFLTLYTGIHKRGYKTLVTNKRNFDFLRFWFSFSAWGVLLISVLTVNVIVSPHIYKWNFELLPFVKILLLLILLLPFRVFFTAIFINSYILQTFNKVFHKRWLSLLASILLFTGLMYISNKNSIINSNYQSMFYYVMLGLISYLILILDEGIEIICGFFSVSFLMRQLFITYNTHQTELNTVFFKEGSKDIAMYAYVIPFICFPLFFILLFYVYKWTDWKEKLFNKKPNNF